MKIRFHQKHIKQFKKMGITVIYLFGSYAQNQTHPLSDVDIGVVFENPEKYKDKTMKVYLKLYEIFSDLLPKEYLKQRFQKKEHEFDIVFLQFVPFGFQFEAIKKGVVLYEKSRKKRFDYEEYVMKKCSDLKHFHNLRYQAILERI
ncbi:nucleotidyltransferase domain-containing protein [bacterium]|nr:nucleotidyltransferase domain-containing protein [bacterium]